jgi:hypothetical protein
MPPTAPSTIAMPTSWTGATPSSRNVAAQTTPSPGCASCRIEISPTGTRSCAHVMSPCEIVPDVTASSATSTHPEAERPTSAPAPSVASEITRVVAPAVVDITAMNAAVPTWARAVRASRR